LNVSWRTTAQAILLLVLSGWVLVIGQLGHELLPPDDLREAEVAREMVETGDYIVPHVAGLPFVEKPPLFQIIVALVFRISGGASIAAARAVSVAFALASVAAVFLLGRRIAGARCGGLAAACLAFSERFCQEAHKVHLDNALTATVAFATLFAWTALEAVDSQAKSRAYAAAAFSLALAFLTKGLIGPALFGAGYLAYIANSGRQKELRYAFGLLPAAAFVAPVGLWLVLFVTNAKPDVIHEFFIDNQLGRFAHGYLSHVRPVYFYLLDIWSSFAPASMFLSFAIAAAWRKRRDAENLAGFFLLTMATMPILILSISQAKDIYYLLPIYPALALLVAWWCNSKLAAGEGSSVIGCTLVAAVVGLLAIAVLAATIVLHGESMMVAGASMLVACALGIRLLALRHRDRWSAAVGTATLTAIGWSVVYAGPLRAYEFREPGIRPYIEKILEVAKDRKIVLYRPSDLLRAGAGFYRNRTVPELRSPTDVINALKEDPQAFCLMRIIEAEEIPPELQQEADKLGVVLREDARVSANRGRSFVLLRAFRRNRPKTSQSS
jgi:4-amino-4-deoxy-L-arabinose transferase-like glycosyltransferase